MLADHKWQKNAGISTERLLKDLSYKGRKLTIRCSVLGPTKIKLTDLADEFEKYFSPSEDHKGDLIYIADIHNQRLSVAKELGDRAGEGPAYGNLGNAYQRLGDFKQAVKYHNQHLCIAKELGDRAGEGRAYGNLGNAYQSLGDFKQAVKYHNQHLGIAKELGDRAGEGRAYGNLGNAYDSLGDFKQAVKVPQPTS